MSRPLAASPCHVLVMGVAGCGKSTLGRALAQRLSLPWFEGDDDHPPANLDKMRRGVPLTDADRAGWLDTLADRLRHAPTGAVLGCSALKRAYRDRLRAAVPGLWVVHLALSEEAARARVAARSHHVFPASLVADQFATLQPPAGETRVLTLDATRPADDLVEAVVAALHAAG